MSMLKELFEGKEELFRGLSINSGRDWSERSPAMHLDFGAGTFKRKGSLEGRFSEMLGKIE